MRDMLLARYFARGHTFESGALAFRGLTGRAAPTTAVPRRPFHSLRGGFLGDSKSLRFLPERAHAASAAAAAVTATTRACRPASSYSTSAAPPFQPKPARAKRRSKKRKRYTQADAVAQLRRGKKIAAFFLGGRVC